MVIVGIHWAYTDFITPNDIIKIKTNKYSRARAKISLNIHHEEDYEQEKLKKQYKHKE